MQTFMSIQLDTLALDKTGCPAVVQMEKRIPQTVNSSVRKATLYDTMHILLYFLLRIFPIEGHIRQTTTEMSFMLVV
ncbi:hypothetical protein Y1Q_0016769 [Alligator mississippiensis]|uniref:Uncharacterized protein n=1 Tax=Alligator mississippiensis TaxID=8496 RepID=A0A151P6A4_ALLMI|nr:hypothetical protein Y1Q_0016769 [Alligator mississippiensis]